MSLRLTLVVALSLGGMPFVQASIDAHRRNLGPQQKVQYLWSPPHIRKLVAGFEGIAADVYWLRTVQYFGAERRTGRGDFSLLGPLIDITTTLDPRLEIAYRYGAIFLCEGWPNGAGRCEEGLALLERGAQAMPEDWRLLQEKGFFAFLFMNDPERAAKELHRAAARPGAAFWLEGLAADTLMKGGRKQSARRMWTAILEASEPGLMRTNAEVRLRLLDAEDLAGRIQAAVERFHQEHGVRPRTLGELKAAGYWSGALVDPEGVEFRYDPSIGAVELSGSSPLWRPDLARKEGP